MRAAFGRRPGPRVLALVVLSLLSAGGCAPALPSFAGARTTPADRVDLLAGMAGRLPTGELASEESLALAAPPGIAPAGAMRVGLSRNVDLGLVLAGASGRAELRWGDRVGALRVHVGVAGFGGYAVTNPDGNGAQGEGSRVGAFVPLTVGFDVGGILEAWAGARAAFEHVEGRLGPSLMNASTDAWGVRGGGVVGLALGLRRVHVLAELAVDGEWWRVTVGPNTLERAGVVLTPAFGVRVRL